MSDKPRVHPSELRGFSQLATDAVEGLTDVVEAMHRNISSVPFILGPPPRGHTRGITGLVYRSIRSVTGLVGQGVDALLAQLEPTFEPMSHGGSSWPGREATLAALNGVLGDFLAAKDSPLALPMSLRQDGQALELDKQALAEAFPRSGDKPCKLVILVHGLALNDLHWHRKGHDHGAALARDLGYTPLYLHYNSGLHVSTNGREFAELLEALLAHWPAEVEELSIVAHSLGGLVSRSACHYGEAAHHQWRRRLSALVFLGTPHQGAPLERGGNWLHTILGISPYTAPLARLGMIRSAGITDLRYGNLLDEDWHHRDRFELSGDHRRSVLLPQDVRCFNIAATTGTQSGALGENLVGDGLVPVNSGLGRHDDPEMNLSFPESRQWVAYGMNHMDLVSHPEVYQQIHKWLGPDD